MSMKAFDVVGEDVLGDYVMHRLAAEGVNIDFVKTTNRATTGYQFKTKVLQGDPTIHYVRRNSAASQLQFQADYEDVIRSSSVVHMTGIPLALSDDMRQFALAFQRTAKQVDTWVTFDPNLRSSLWPSTEVMVETVNEFAIQSDIVFPGLLEGEILTGFTRPEDIAAFYIEQGVKLVIIKLGPNGAYFKASDGQGYIPGFSVDHVVDTVGAGDGFAVGVISGIVEKLPIERAIERGCAIGALAVTSEGELEGLPTRDKLNAFMNPFAGRVHG
jgi:2-dehydro-3-deoxygluconokinase